MPININLGLLYFHYNKGKLYVINYITKSARLYNLKGK